MAPDILYERYEERRSQFLREAMEHAMMLCLPPDTFVDRKRSDQFWLRLFSTLAERISSEHVHVFLRDFGLSIGLVD